MSEKPKLSVILPAYNEERRLPRTLRSIHGYLTKQAYPYEIIVVNDGSTDHTAQLVRKLKQEIPHLALIDNKENNGKGFVVRQGLLAAKGEYRLFTDSDNSTSIDQIERMWPELEKGFAIVIGSRDIEGAVLAPPQTWFRQTLGNIFNLLEQVVLGLWGVWDMQCGFKCFTEKAVKDILPRCIINRWAFDGEIMALAKKLGYRIKEVPVIWVNDSESRVQFKGMVNMLLELAKIRWQFWGKKYNEPRN